MKKSRFFFIVLIASGIAMSAQAQNIGLESFKQQFSSINDKANWKPFSEGTDVEFYYDADNIQHPSPDSVILAIKTVYKSQKAIDRLKHERARLNTKGANDEPMNYYNDLSFTISMDKIYCTIKEVGSQGIEADFDKDGHLLNILPSAKGRVPIVSNTHIEKLYSLVCEKADNKTVK